MTRSPLTRVVLAVLTGPLLLAVAAGPATAAGISSDTYEGQIGTRTKQIRVNHDRPAVRWGSCLDSYAERQARIMARKQSLEHQDLGPILRHCDLRMVGENIAVGYPTGNAAMDAWMNSKGHRANILNPGYRRFGHGAVKDANGRWWTSEVFGTH